VIRWKDFILDDIVGPILALPEEMAAKDERPATNGRDDIGLSQFGSSLDTRNGAVGTNTAQADIQETRQEQQPARMAGLSSHDSAPVDRTLAGSDRTEPYSRLVGGEG
jgi:hypothetical protein